jgi:hypothetical protein
VPPYAVRWTIVPLGLPTPERAVLAARSPLWPLDARMHLLYLDESGHSHDPSTDFFVLAGFSVFERATHWLESAINPVAARFNPLHPESVEFHGAPMRGGKEYWKGIDPALRVQAVVDILSLLSNPQLKLRVFASVIEKSTMNRDEVLTKSFENVAGQFDQYLANIYYTRRDPQRGLVIFDKAAYEEKLQGLSAVFKNHGHSLGKFRNFSEVPLFLDSKASRLIQMADLIAYWIFRYFQSGDDRGYRLIAPHFHANKGVQHGFIKMVTPACEQRLVSLPVQPHPFPPPTPIKPAAAPAVDTGGTVVEVSVSTASVTIATPSNPG